MKKSDFENRDTTLVSSGKKPDMFYPSKIWSLTRFTKVPSSMTVLTKSKQVVSQLKIILEKSEQDYRNNTARIKTDTSNKISMLMSDLRYEEQDMINQFERRREGLLLDRDDEIKRLTDVVDSQKKETIMNFDATQKRILSDYRQIQSLVNEILDDYKIHPNEKIVAEDFLTEEQINEVTVDELLETIDIIDVQIEKVIDNGNIVNKINKTIDKVDGDKKGLFGKIGSVATVILAPVTVVGGAMAVMVNAELTTEAMKEINSLAIRLLAIQDLATRRFNAEISKPKVNVSDMSKDFEERKSAIYEQYDLSLNNLSREYKEWEEDFKNRKDDNFKERLERTAEKDILYERDKYQNLKSQTESEILKAEENFLETKTEFDKDNEIPEIQSSVNEEINSRLSNATKLVNKHIELEVYNKLIFNTNPKTEEPNEIKRAEYDKYLEGEKEELETHLKNEAALGRDEDYWINLKKDISIEEDPLYILDLNKLHLGELLQEQSNAGLGAIEQATADIWGNGSVLFLYRDEVEEDIMINYSKYLTQQCISNMSPKALRVNIINPTQDIRFVDMIIDTTDESKNRPPYVDVYQQKSIETVTAELMRQIYDRQTNLLIKGSMDIANVVREKRREGSKTPIFHLNLLHRVELGNDVALLSETSKYTGIVNFHLIDKREITTTREDEGRTVREIENDDLSRLRKYDTIVEVETVKGKDVVLNVYNKNELKYKQVKYTMKDKSYFHLNREFFTKRYFTETKSVPALLIDEFINKITGGKYWSKSAHKDIEIYFGYVNGDKSDTSPVIMDETSKVHLMIGGTTGGGKSVMLATIANSLKACYPPSEATIYYYDFKKVEVALHSSPYKWPNARCLAGSATAEYFTTLLDNVTNLMTARYSLMEKSGVNKLSSYREFLANRYVVALGELLDRLQMTHSKDGLKKMELYEHYQRTYMPKVEEFLRSKESTREYIEEELMLADIKKIQIPPRAILIIDEVQEGFKIDDETTDKLKATLDVLSKVARAAGLHMILLTQDPGSVIPGPVLGLFTLRACTKATPEVSKSLLGTPFCSLPENQFMGFAGVNTSGTGDEDADIQYVVPFTSEEHTQLYTKLFSDLADNTPFESSNNPVVYSDSDVYTFAELDKTFEEMEYAETLIEVQESDKPYVRTNLDMILGYKIAYQERSAPAMIRLNKDSKQSIAFISSIKKNKINFLKTISRSINNNGHSALVLFGKDADSEYELDNMFDNHILQLSYAERKSDGMKFPNENKYEEIGARVRIPMTEEQLESSSMYTDDEIEFGILVDNDEDFIRDPDKFMGVPALDASWYSSKPSFSSNEEDNSFTGKLTFFLTAYVEYRKQMKRKGEELPPAHLILIDPEKDAYAVQDRFFTSKEITMMANEASSTGLFLTIITSAFELFEDRDYLRYVIGQDIGSAASFSKDFKKLVKPFAKLSDKVDRELSTTFKVAIESGEGSDQHLYGGL